MKRFDRIRPYPVFLRAEPEASYLPNRIHLSLSDDAGNQGGATIDLNQTPPLKKKYGWGSFVRDYQKLNVGEPDLIRFGRGLFDYCFSDTSLREAWRAIRRVAGKRPLALTVLFGHRAERMFSLPLELLYDEDGFVFAKPHASLKRAFAGMPPEPYAPPKTPRVLFVWACPEGAGDSFDPAPHQQVLADLFQDRLTVCPKASLADIEAVLDSAPAPFDWVHALAHGDRDELFGGVALEGPGGGPDFVEAGRLAQAFQGKGGKLAFLCSCKTALTGDRLLSGVGQRLLYPTGGGFQAVVATQANLPVAQSADMARLFYQLLLEGESDPAEALARARIRAYRDANAWSVPILLTRPPRQTADTAPLRRDWGLPAKSETFQERPELMSQIIAAVRGSRLVSVVGLPGIGKTELGKEASRRLMADGFRDRAFYHVADPTLTAERLRAIIGTWLGWVQPPEDDAVLAKGLGERPTLLVLDNAEDMMADADDQHRFRRQLNAWLAGAPDLRVLLTTRWPVSGTRVREKAIRVPPMSQDDAERLLVRELEQAGVYNSAWPREAAWRNLLALLDGHPRSIWLVAHHFEGHGATPARIVKRLETLKVDAVMDVSLIGRQDVEKGLSDEERDRMLSLAASMDFSYEVLQARHPEAARLFLGLSYFPAGLPNQVAEAVAGTSDSLALEQLYRYSLLESEQDVTYYPKPLKWYAEDRAKKTELDHAPYFERALHAYAAYTARCDGLLSKGTELEAMARWLREEDTVMTLVKWRAGRESNQSGASALARIAAYSRNLLMLSDRLEVWRTLADAGRQDAKRQDDAWGEANCLKSLGDLAIRVDDLAAAQSHFQAALPIFRAIEDRLGEAYCLKSLGDLAIRVDDLAAAQSHYQAALPIFRAIESRLGEANCLKSLGDLAIRVSDLAAAQSHFQAALPIFRTIEDRLGEAYCLKSLGDLAIRVDDLAAAQSHFQAALPIFRAIESRLGEANCLKSLGDLAIRVSDLAAAQSHFQAALPIFRTIEDRLGEAYCLKSLGDLAIRVDDLAAAQSHFQAALPIFRAIESRLGEANCLQSLGDLAIRVDDLAAAHSHFQAALPIYRAIESRLGEANCLQSLGDLAIRVSDLAAAQSHFQAALPIFRAIESRLGEANCLKSLGDLAIRVSDLAAAHSHFQAALPIFRAIESRLGEANCLQSLGDLAIRVSDLAAAHSHFQAALPIYRAIEDRLGEANCLKSLGDLAIRVSDLAAAQSHFQAALPIFRAIESRLGEANCLQSLGDLAIRVDDLAAAHSHFQAALPIYRAIEDRLGEANCLQGLGLLALGQDEPEKGQRWFADALAIHRAIDNRLGEQAALGYLARTALALSKLDQALFFSERSLAIGRSVEDRFGQLINLQLQISVFAEQETHEGLLAAAFLLKELALEIDHRDMAAPYEDFLRQNKAQLPADAWRGLTRNAESIRARAVAAAIEGLDQDGVAPRNKK